MVTIGIVLVVVAAILIILGLAVEAVHVLLWIGLVLIVLGAVLWLVGYRGRTGPPV